MNVDYSIVGMRIQDIRRGKKISQAKLAEMVDVSTPYLSQVECGKKQVSLTVLLKISIALETSLDALLGLKTDDKEFEVLEFDHIARGCSEYEKKILMETMTSLKRTLQNNKNAI